MRDWFPLTNYEFYAFVSAGMLLVAVTDYCLADAILVNRTDWNVVEIVFWIVVSYLIGHLCASASSTLLEHVLTRTLLRSPTEVISGLSERRWTEHAAAFLGAARREYAPLPAPVRQKLLLKVSNAVSCPIGELTPETVFEAAFSAARSNADAAARMDQFLNTYGLCRNVSFVSLVATVLLGRLYVVEPTSHHAVLLVSAVVMAAGMYGRFLKYYSAYAREVLRTYANLGE